MRSSIFANTVMQRAQLPVEAGKQLLRKRSQLRMRFSGELNEAFASEIGAAEGKRPGETVVTAQTA